MNQAAKINVSVSSHYRQPSYASELASQGILGESVTVMATSPAFTQVRQEDGYESWVSTDQLTWLPPPHGTSRMVRSHHLLIHREPRTDSPAIRDAVIGCRLAVRGETDGWYRLTLPDGAEGWAEKRHFGTFPPFSPTSITTLAREFLGYQYCWGGRTPKGFDCSGLVQTVFRLHGQLLPRDSWQQQQQFMVADDPSLAEPGDLLFFAKTPERVTHVAIALGGERFLHASGWVRCNSLRPTDPDFSPRHRETFVSVNRYQI
jgi:gamma-D-glutamyl-L-lysine dipeptidyl-peptidase